MEGLILETEDTVKQGSPVKMLIAGLRTRKTAETCVAQLLEQMRDNPQETASTILDALAAADEKIDENRKEEKTYQDAKKTETTVVKILREMVLMPHILSNGDVGKGTSRFMRCGDKLLIAAALTGSKEGKLSIVKMPPEEFTSFGFDVRDMAPKTPDKYKRTVVQLVFPTDQLEQELKILENYVNVRRSENMGFRVEAVESHVPKDSEAVALHDLRNGLATFKYVVIKEDFVVKKIGNKGGVTIGAGSEFEIDKGKSDRNSYTLLYPTSEGITPVKVPASVCEHVEWCSLTFPKQLSIKPNKKE